MKIRKAVVPLYYILEAVSSVVARGEDGFLDLEGRMGFVSKFLPCTRVNRNVITIQKRIKADKYDRQVPCYNYLMVYQEIIYYSTLDRSVPVDSIWYIVGFDTFRELEEYALNPEKDVPYFQVFVRCCTGYEKAIVRFSYEDAYGKRRYTNRFGIDKFIKADIWNSDGDSFNCRIEIPGLLEFHRLDEVVCELVGSFDEASDHLEMLRDDVLDLYWNNDMEEYYEEGKMYFERKEFKYILSDEEYDIMQIAKPSVEV